MISQTEEGERLQSTLWWKWLLVVNMLLVVFGICMIFFNRSLLKFMARDCYNSIFQEGAFANLGPKDLAFQNWVYGVLGSVVIGWGITLIFLTNQAYRKGQRWAWQAMVVSFSLWYVLDTGTSLYHGVIPNVISNTGIALLYAIPLFFSTRQFTSRASIVKRSIKEKIL